MTRKKQNKKTKNPKTKQLQEKLLHHVKYIRKQLEPRIRAKGISPQLSEKETILLSKGFLLFQTSNIYYKFCVCSFTHSFVQSQGK